jgi:hypothetical protein
MSESVNLNWLKEASLDLAGYRVLSGRGGPFGLLGMFRRHKFYCRNHLHEMFLAHRADSNVRGAMIVEDGGVVRHLGFPSESDARVTTETGHSIPAQAVAITHNVRLILSTQLVLDGSKPRTAPGLVRRNTFNA